MTSTTTPSVRVPAPRTPAHDVLPAPVARATVSSLADPALTARALRSGTRLAADALTGIALDDPCGETRRRGLVRFTAGVVAEVRAAAGPLRPGDADDERLHAVLALAERGLALFAREVSAGAPVLALVLTELADLVEARPAGARPLPPTRRAPRQALFALPLLLDACHPAERAAVLANATRAERAVLRLGAPGHAAARDAVLGRAG
jgi:hypothetical protein